MTIITRNDIIREINLANTKQIDTVEDFLVNMEEFDEDFIEFVSLIKTRFSLEFEDYSESFYELLNCDTLYMVMEFICKNNNDIKIAENEK